MRFVLRFRAFLFSMAIVFLLASCLDDNFADQPVDVAYVSIYHAAPDVPDIDIIVDDRVINNQPFDYSSYSGYLNFYTGERKIKFSTVSNDNTIVDTTFNLKNGKVYSIFAVNTLPHVEALLVKDSVVAPAAGKARVRFINLSPDAPAFDLTADDGTLLFTELAFKEASEFDEIDPDTYTFHVTNAGSTEDVVIAEGVEILPGKFYTILARGFVSPPGGNTNVLSLEVLY